MPSSTLGWNPYKRQDQRVVSNIYHMKEIISWTTLILHWLVWCFRVVLPKKFRPPSLSTDEKCGSVWSTIYVAYRKKKNHGFSRPLELRPMAILVPTSFVFFVPTLPTDITLTTWSCLLPSPEPLSRPSHKPCPPPSSRLFSLFWPF